MKQLRRVLLFFLLVNPSLEFRAEGTASSAPDGAESFPGKAQLQRSIALAASYMVRSCGPDGRFVYRVDPVSGEKGDSYNVTRHAGAMYALGMVYDAQPSQPVAEALRRSAAYLRDTYLGPVPGTDQLAVWSTPKPRAELAQLGATGLGLVALTVARQAGGAVEPGELEAMGRFLLALQRPDGSFAHRYSRSGGALGGWQSLYYPGEAALGLIRLYRLDGSTQWLSAAIRTLVFLAASGEGVDHVPPDNWFLVATGDLLALPTTGGVSVPREQLLRHAGRIVTELLNEENSLAGTDSRMDGSFDSLARSSPAATSLEGLLAGLSMLRQDDPGRSRILPAAARGINFLLRAQITSGPYEGGVPEAALGTTPAERSVRIDVVQHMLCACLRYRALVSGLP